jgi:hypothetical protein
MRKWLLLLAILLALLIGAGVFYFMDREEMTPHQREHLAAEAERLVVNRDKIDQPDAAWIAEQLGSRPSADRLARLGAERMESLNREHAATLERDYPELWDAWALAAEHAGADNGQAALEQAGELAEAIKRDDRFKELMASRGSGDYPREHAAAYLNETQPLLSHMREAATTAHIVWVPPRMESWLDPIDMPMAYHSFWVLSIRVALLADAGRVDEAVDELDLLMDLFSRADWRMSLIASIGHTIVSDFLLRNAALPLVEGRNVDGATARRWLERAAAIRRDLAYAMAIDLVQTAHLNISDPTLGFVSFLAPDSPPEYGMEPRRVEDVFFAMRRNARTCLRVAAYVHGPRLSLLTLEGQQQLGKALENAPFISSGSFIDDLEERLKWAALDLRIAELEQGSLDQTVVNDVLTRWPALRAEWADGTLQLWVRTEYRFGRAPDRPLHELDPRQ